MIKEIGSIFPVYEPNEREDGDLLPVQENEVYLSLAREAFLYLAKTIGGGNHRVMLPAYTCQTVIDPFEQENWACYFYGINQDLRIDEQSFRELLSEVKPEVIVFHPYYGLGISSREVELLQNAKEAGATIIEDMTQVLFSGRTHSFVDYYLGSLRKWFDIPDGAFLSSRKHPLPEEAAYSENEIFTRLQKDAMYLRGEYFRTGNPEIKQISIRLNKYAVNLVAGQNIAIHRMSRYSKQNYRKSDIAGNQKARLENYRYLLTALKESQTCLPVNHDLSNLESAPLYFPIYVPNRTDVQKELACNRIYAPVLWPVLDTRVLVSDEVRYIYEHILLLPIDQRYTIADMESIAKVLN